MRAGLIFGFAALVGCAALSGLDDLGVPDAIPPGAGGGSSASSSGTTTSSSTSGDTSPPPDADACPGKDLDRDPDNCGRCGHDCLGGDCDDGACEPTAILRGLTNPSGIAVAGGALYVATSTKIQRAGLDGKGLVDMVTGIAPRYLAATATHLYWADRGGAGAVMRWPLAGGPTATLVAGVTSALGIGVGPEHVYFTHDMADGGVERALLDGGSRESVLPLDHPDDVEVAGGELIVGSDGTDELAVFADGGFGAKRVLSSGNGPVAMAVDGPDVFHVQQEDDAIRRVALAGGGKLQLARAGGNPCGIAATATALYWVTCNSAGNVMRLAR